MNDWTDGFWLKIINILIWFLTSIVMSHINPAVWDNKWSYTGRLTYFSPAPYWLILRWLIGPLTFGLSIYQFTENGKRSIIKGIGWWWPLLAILNAAYLIVWLTENYAVAFILTLLTWGVISRIYYMLKSNRVGRSIHDQLWIRVPFSLYHSSTTVLVAVAAFEAFGTHAYLPAGAWTKSFVFLGLLFLEASSEAYAFQSDGGDVAATMTITFSLIAILLRQWWNEFVRWPALVFAILSLFGVFKSTRALILGPYWGRTLQVINVVLCPKLALLGLDILLSIIRKSYLLVKQTYFTPAPYAFSIWVPICFLPLGTIVYQFTDRGKKTIINGMGWQFPILVMLNFGYIYLSLRGRFVTGFILVLLAWTLISYIYYILKKHHAAENIHDRLWIHIPISLWHAWSTVLLVVAGFEAFGVSAEDHPATIFTKIPVLFGLLFLAAASEVYASPDEGDLVANLVITWSLVAIFIHQRSSEFVHWAALAAAIASVLCVFKSAYGLVRTRYGAIRLGDEENAGVPLANERSGPET